MPTEHIWRLIEIIPVGKVPAVVGWMNNNLGPNSVPFDLGPPLNATGLESDPVTHRWCNGAWTDPECKAILGRLANLAGIAVPSGGEWGGWSKREKREWLLSVRNGIWTGFGAWVTMAENEGDWDDALAEAARVGLKPIEVQAGGA